MTRMPDSGDEAGGSTAGRTAGDGTSDDRAVPVNDAGDSGLSLFLDEVDTVVDPLSESFVVLLNPEGTRLLRSWRHVEHCPQCGGNQTAELSLAELRSASLA